MRPREREEQQPSDERALADAFSTLAALPAIRQDAGAARALELIAGRIDPSEVRKQRRLARAAQIVNSTLELDEVLRSVLALAADVMNAERGYLILSEGNRVAAAHDPTSLQETPDEPARAILARVLETGQPVFTTDAQSDPDWSAHDAIVTLHLRSIACVPLRVRDKTIGAVYLDSRVLPGLFKPGDRELLVAFALQAAMAIENARLFADERARLLRISELQAFQTRLLEAIASGVITLSASHEITTFNRAAEGTFGLVSHEMVGLRAEALAACIPDFPELLETFHSAGAVQLRAQVEATNAQGSELVLELRLAPLESPEGMGVAVVVTDNTTQRRIEESFSRYLAPHVVQSLMHDPASIRLGGERRRATMMFADVRGFTALASTLGPERVVEILNGYFEEAVGIVFEYDGLLDKFYGDGLMAVFGPPRVRGDDAARAVAASIRLHEVVRGLAPKLDYPLQISVGLATGDVVAGHFGSTQRMDYTVIGDAVNLANGLQSAAPPGSIYCDEETFRSAGPIARATHRLAARVKGRAELVTAYAIFPDEHS
jgi:PAS domain S-box-containing protein